MLKLADKPPEKLPFDVGNRISAFAVEIKRFAVQLGAVECDEIEQKVIDHAVRIISTYADTFEMHENNFSRTTSALRKGTTEASTRPWGLSKCKNN